MLKFEHYELTADKHLELFEFISEGPNGRIRKVVQFSQTNFKRIYNLGFGDFIPGINEIDDTVISNNGDSQKVLATVVAAVYAFTDRHPHAFVFATGSTKARTRLYRIGISNNLSDVNKDFEIYGRLNGEWKKFSKQMDCDAFLVKRK